MWVVIVVNVTPISRAQLNTTCAYISNTLPAGQDWNAGSCGTSRGYICQKPEGQGSLIYELTPLIHKFV